MQDYIVPIIIGAVVLLAIIIFMCNYIKVPPNVAHRPRRRDLRDSLLRAGG